MNFIKKNFSYKFQGQPNQNFLLNKNKIYELLEKNKIDFSNKAEFNKNIASSTQKIFEEFLFKIVNTYKVDNENLCTIVIVIKFSYNENSKKVKFLKIYLFLSGDKAEVLVQYLCS